MRAHASWGSQQDVMLVFLNQDAYDRYRLSKEDFELLKELEKEQKKAKEKDDKKKDGNKSKKEKTEKEKAKSSKDKDSDKDEADEDKAEDKADKKDIVVELNGIEDRIVRLTPNSSDLGSAILSKDGENLYYFSSFEGGYDLWKMNLREASAQT